MSQSDEQGKDVRDTAVDGEVIAEYTDTILNLPPLDDEEGGEGGRDRDAEPDPGRRGFVVRMVIGGMAALAAGGGAALIYDRARRREPQVVILPNGAEVDSDDVAALIERIAGLDSALAAMTAERDQVLSELNQASADLAALRAQYDESQRTLDEYRGLIALWQQLDAIGLDGLLQGALAGVGGALASLLRINVLLRAGLTAGQAAIDGFLAAMPGPRDGIRWLGAQVTALSDSLIWLADQVKKAIDPTEPFARMIAEFVLWVLNRLPFGVGARAKDGLEAMEAVITGLPGLVEGINRDVLDPLADWLGDQAGERSLTAILIRPVRESVVAPAGDVVDEVLAFDRTFKSDLAGPVEDALARRAELRSEIEAAQARLGLRA